MPWSDLVPAQQALTAFDSKPWKVGFALALCASSR